MIEKLMNLLERFVVAVEFMAKAHANFPDEDTTAEVIDSVDVAPDEPQTAAQAAKEKADLSKWNPYDHDLQKAYRADKQAILDAELAVLGIDGSGMTGAQKHEAILNHTGDNAPDEPEVEEEVVEEAATDARKIEHKDIMSALQNHMKSFSDPNEGKKAVIKLLNDVAGVAKVSDVPEEKYHELYNAIPGAA